MIDQDQRAGRPPKREVSTFTALLTPPDGTPATRTRRDALAEEAQRHVKGEGPRRPLRWVVLLLVGALVVGGAGLGAAYSAFPEQVKALFGWSNDYRGAGTGAVQVTIREGDLGSDVAATLASAGVTKTESAFYELLLKTKPEPTLQPGTYRLARHMSAAAALAALQDPKRLVVASVTLPEGSTVAQILTSTARATGVPLAELKAAAEDYRSLGVPAEAPSLEGYLFPATYRFEPGTGAKAMLRTMVRRMYQSLDQAGVAAADRHRVLTFASLVQKEGNGRDDPKIAQVFYNRLKRGMPLQSDASVNYGVGGTSVNPTPKQFADRNPYNTYRRKGLPVGPIASPGDTAIRATTAPAKGPWLFFVTVNLETGRTVFSTTDAQHEKAAAEFRRWLKANPDYGK